MHQTYAELRARQQEEYNNFPIAYAFGKEQLAEAMTKLGLQPTQTELVTSVFGCGDILRKTDVPALMKMLKTHREELAAAMKSYDFAYDAFDEELANHEYSYTTDSTDALNALGITESQILNTPHLREALNNACQHQIERQEKQN